MLAKIVLDWPASVLFPNKKAHWAVNKRSRDLQREAAFFTAKQAGWSKPVTPVHRVHLCLTFCAPSKRRFDLDGALSAMKGAIDGLSACLGVDDSLFTYTLQRGEKTQNGAVIVIAEVA